MKSISYREAVLQQIKKERNSKLNELVVPMLKEETKDEIIKLTKQITAGNTEVSLSADAEADWIQAQAKAKELLKKQLK